MSLFDGKFCEEDDMDDTQDMYNKVLVEIAVQESKLYHVVLRHEAGLTHIDSPLQTFHLAINHIYC